MKSLLTIFSLLLASLCGPLSAAEPASRPNVVLIIADDQGYTDYGFMGHAEIRTPHLDRLAAQSLVFPRGYVPSSLCCPSLASIITGRYPHQHRITANDPPAAAGQEKAGRGSSAALVARWNGALDSIATLPRVLGRHGYLSLQTGKWWHGDFTRGGFTHGMTTGSRHGDAGLAIGREGLQPIYDFIRDSRQLQKPFLVWYAPMMPHTPHTPPEALFTKYQARTDSPHLARYWAMCEWFDQTCGELLGHLDREGLAENTLVLYVADNGWVQDPARPKFAPKNKTTPYDFGHRTPILVRWPGKVAPRRSTALASSIDLLPTVLAALKLAPEPGLPGVDLLDEQAVAARKQVFGECFTVRSQTLDDPAANLLWRWSTDGRWRLIVPRTWQAAGALQTIPADSYLTPDLRETLVAAQPMLFDVEADPREEKNLAATHPEITAAMLRQLDAWWKPQPKHTP